MITTETDVSLRFLDPRFLDPRFLDPRFLDPRFREQDLLIYQTIQALGMMETHPTLAGETIAKEVLATKDPMFIASRSIVAMNSLFYQSNPKHPKARLSPSTRITRDLRAYRWKPDQGSFVIGYVQHMRNHGGPMFNQSTQINPFFADPEAVVSPGAEFNGAIAWDAENAQRIAFASCPPEEL